MSQIVQCLRMSLGGPYWFYDGLWKHPKIESGRSQNYWLEDSQGLVSDCFIRFDTIIKKDFDLVVTEYNLCASREQVFWL